MTAMHYGPADRARLNPGHPNNPTRTRKHPFDRTAYRLRNIIERTSSRLNNWRRVETRYDKLARNFRAVLIASIASYWL
jgi:putative transposase